ncbi:hypothetical protein DFH06DRAFT_522075 [Mycena polygramma]|nr:hypothetical protein DFH06DRAFT_522075 [Mycena polygramma]
MRYRTLEIRWHDSKPISSCDFQPVPFKKARPPQGGTGDVRGFASQAYRLATAGEDNLWMVHPNIGPRELEANAAGAGEKLRPARLEYVAILSRHSVERFSPNGVSLAMCQVLKHARRHSGTEDSSPSPVPDLVSRTTKQRPSGSLAATTKGSQKRRVGGPHRPGSPPP